MSLDDILLLPLAGGVILLVGGALSFYRTRKFVERAQKAPGKVIGLYEVPSEDGTSYSPIVRFNDFKGRVVEFTDPIYSQPAGYKVGDQVEVLYDPHKVDQARVASLFRLYMKAGILMLLGLALFGAWFFGSGRLPA